MGLYVHKYGGTSVGSVERIQAVAEKVARCKRQGHDVVVVVSAMSGETNRLIGLAKSIQSEPDPREMDMLVSTGEQVTIALLSMALKKLGCNAKSYTGGQVKILTDDAHTKARIQSIEVKKIENDIADGNVVVVAGFQGVNENGQITTLGRGGSDTTGVAIAAALGADECQIYTDVDGVYTTDPRIEPNARRMTQVTFEEMLEMASLGSKVLQIRSVELAGKYRLPLRVLSTFEDGEGTLITFDEESTEMEKPVVSGIAFNKDEAKLSILGVSDKPGMAAKILSAISEQNIEIDVIVQNIAADGSNDLSFTVNRSEMANARKTLEGLAVELGARVLSDDKIVKVSIVGVGMRSHAGVASTMFSALAQENINIQMITTSEIKVSVIIEERYLELAVRVLHKAFGLDEV